jgi:hypothetical protein
MHVDHIDPHGGDNVYNLCLACWNCNTSKHQATAALDPETQEMVRLFNPRHDEWPEHFEWIDGGIWLRGLTAIGRATIDRLKMNRAVVVIARKRWIEGGYHPPVDV